MKTGNFSTFDRNILAAKKTIDSIYDFFSKIKDFQRELDIDEAASFYTQGVDDVIIDENIFLLKLDLYFQDAEEKWAQRSTQTTKALKYLTPQAVQELRGKREIAFEIDPPKEKAAPAPASASTPTPEPIPTPAAKAAPAADSDDLA